MTLTITILALAILAGIAAFIWQQTKAKGRWGIGAVVGAHCPRCGGRLPAIRKPSSMRETLWGGATCPQCGCKIDKYGREIAS